ncbi:hypothetical protein Tco_0689188 [Tanacetum coccineum]
MAAEVPQTLEYKGGQLNVAPMLEVFSTWMAFGGNTRDFGSFGEEMDKITTLHQESCIIVHTTRGDGIAIIKRQRQDVADLKRI